MHNAIFSFESPQNEPVLQYEEGSRERNEIIAELNRLSNEQIEIPLIIGGKEIRTGITARVVMPHNHAKTLAIYHQAIENEVQLAINEALKAKSKWENLSWFERSSIMLRAADLVATKYRSLIVASTMLGQDKNLFQAEIDAACEIVDYLKYNVHFASQIYSEQPKSEKGQLNRIEYRPLEGFIFTVSPFNFTGIASNLNMSVALMGNTTVWKPATTSLLSSYYLMKIFQEAGLPDGVINFVPGSGSLIGNVVLKHKDLAGVHFTGSTETFNTLWRGVSENLSNYVSYPKLVGETGGKDFIFVHNSANPIQVATAIVRGAFEYQGQKCSAASRSYIPKSLWDDIKQHILNQTSRIRVGDVADFDNFMNAVIDESSYDKIMNYIDLAKKSDECEIITGGTGDKSVGYFIQPTVILTTNPDFVTVKEEIFGPVMTVFVYEDQNYEDTLSICNTTSAYALTGAIFSNDKYATMQACDTLRYAAGNFYINDKPSGAMVGLQPFGGSRASGTNDKSGSKLNLLRWVSPRTIKETFIPAEDFKYP
ncbi:MAG: L-glutamate gamma-semialdehyde dehydrogenase, partial [Opitutaceae bacterium]